MNLLKAPWLYYRYRDGSERQQSISAIVDPEVIDFALPRADFQGAAYQFAIGLLQTLFAPDNNEQWHDYYEQPPESMVLDNIFETAAHAFEVLGDGPCFMQDFEPLEKAKPSPVSGLLIEAPGENTLKQNTDHFIKRGIGESISLEMAILALFTLQINAPSGGQGHRVGLRGGGPLTTLIKPQQEGASLWKKLWLNIIDRDYWSYPTPDLHGAEIFPWLAPTRTSEKKTAEIYQKQVHPLHVYWAMPRRVRLLVDKQAQVCQLSGVMPTASVSYYRTLNYGYNYVGTWDHPLTPYRSNPKKPDEEHLSVKGQPGGLSYKIWHGLTFSSNEYGQHAAKVVSYFSEHAIWFSEAQSNIPRLWAFAYDMDNMKARGWYSTEFPLFFILPAQQESILREIKILQQFADNALKKTRAQIKAAWFTKPEEAKGDMSFIDISFWQMTEALFFTCVEQLQQRIQAGHITLSPEQAEQWLIGLRRVALQLFDDNAFADFWGDHQGVKERVEARCHLHQWFYGKAVKSYKKQFNIDDSQEKTV